MFLAIFDGPVHQLGIFGLFGGGKDEGRICCSILGFIFADSLRELDFCPSSIVRRAREPCDTLEGLLAKSPMVLSARSVECRAEQDGRLTRVADHSLKSEKDRCQRLPYFQSVLLQLAARRFRCR